MPTSSYLFVNKNARSSCLTHGATAETTAIQQFVQKGRKRRRKGKIESLFKAIKQQSRSPCKDGNPTVLPHTLGTCHSESITITEVEGDPNSRGALPHIEGSALAVAKRLVVSTVPSAISTSLDPFQTTSVTIDQTVRGLLTYYTTIYHPTMWPNESQALRRGGYVFANAVNHVVHTSFHDSLAMYCLLTASLCRIRHVDHLPFSASANENFYMSQALSLMQARIKKAAEANDTNLLHLLTSVIFLSAAEAYRDGLRASRMHLEAAMDILKYANTDVKQISDPNLQGQFFMSDLFISCVNLEPCLFPSSDYDPGPLTVLGLQSAELLPLLPELEHTAESFLENPSLSPDVKLLASCIRETYTLKCCLNTADMSPRRALQTTHWVTKRNMAIRNRLLSVFPGISRSSASSVSVASASLGDAPSPVDKERDLLVDKVMRTALVMYTLLSMNITGRVKTVKVMARHLERLLKPLLLDACRSSAQPGRSCNDTDQMLLLWTVVIGCSCAQDGSETEQWFVEQCLMLTEVAGCTNLEGLEKIQSTYFYHTQIQRPRLQKLMKWRTAAEERLTSIL